MELGKTEFMGVVIGITITLSSLAISYNWRLAQYAKAGLEFRETPSNSNSISIGSSASWVRTSGNVVLEAK